MRPSSRWKHAQLLFYERTSSNTTTTRQTLCSPWGTRDTAGMFNKYQVPGRHHIILRVPGTWYILIVDYNNRTSTGEEACPRAVSSVQGAKFVFRLHHRQHIRLSVFYQGCGCRVRTGTSPTPVETFLSISTCVCSSKEPGRHGAVVVFIERWSPLAP